MRGTVSALGRWPGSASTMLVSHHRVIAARTRFNAYNQVSKFIFRLMLAHSSWRLAVSEGLEREMSMGGRSNSLVASYRARPKLRSLVSFVNRPPRTYRTRVCPEEIGVEMGWLDPQQVLTRTDRLGRNEYTQYLRRRMTEVVQQDG